jgi:hypothetical protein
MKHFERESLLLHPVEKYLCRRSFTSMQTEVQFYEFRIDLYAFSQRKDLTVAIELKLQKWKRALHQALLYQLCADLAFIALPEYVVPRVDVDQLAGSGIGLISVSAHGCKQVLEAVASPVVRPHYRDCYLEHVRSRA